MKNVFQNKKTESGYKIGIALHFCKTFTFSKKKF